MGRARRVVLMCPKCFTTKEFDVYETSSTCDFVLSTENINVQAFTGFPIYEAYCDECGEEMFDCDSEIAYPIKLFNQKGYKTEFSCEGHIPDENSVVVNSNGSETIVIDRPYILFRSKLSDNIFPENSIWGIDNEWINKDFRTRIEVNPDIFDLCSNESWFKDLYIGELIRVAESLPIITEGISKRCKEDIPKQYRKVVCSSMYGTQYNK